MKKIFILFVLTFFTCINSFASEIALTEELTIEIPDNFKQNKSKKNYFSDSKNGTSICIASEDNEDFSIKEVLASMDTRTFKLSDYKLVNEVKEPIYELGKNYVKRYYEKGKNKAITYTFHTRKAPYSILYTYKSDADEKQFDQIIESINYSPGLWSKLVSIASYSKGAIFLLTILYGFFGYICVMLFAKGRGVKTGCIVILIYFLLLIALLYKQFNGWWDAAIIYAITIHFTAQSMVNSKNGDGDSATDLFEE